VAGCRAWRTPDRHGGMDFSIQLANIDIRPDHLEHVAGRIRTNMACRSPCGMGERQGNDAAAPGVATGDPVAVEPFMARFDTCVAGHRNFPRDDH
jgi:hypothetical protein